MFSELKKRILVVEDHADTGRGLKMYLELLGYEVTITETSKAARKVSRSERFDLLVSDLNLPDGTGWDLLKRLQQKKPVHAIAISGWGSAEDVAKSKAAGFFAHLVKPIIPEELAEAIRKVLAASSAMSSIGAQHSGPEFRARRSSPSSPLPPPQ